MEIKITDNSTQIKGAMKAAAIRALEKGGGGRPTPWVYEDAKGNWHRTEGNKAQPFIKPAVAGHASKYRQIINDELKNG